MTGLKIQGWVGALAETRHGRLESLVWAGHVAPPETFGVG
jgi:hypothetical protein